MAGTVVPRDALQAEAEIFDTQELTRLAEVSDIGTGTIDALNETAELLCRAYPSTRPRCCGTGPRGGFSMSPVCWAVPLGCPHYDLGEREEAEAARQAAYQWPGRPGTAS